MQRTIKLPAIFADGNICSLEGYDLRETRVPPRTVGTPHSRMWTEVKGFLRSRVLSLRLDGDIHSFIDTQNKVNYSNLERQLDLKPPRVIAIRQMQTVSNSLTLLLIDEALGKPIGVIGETIIWNPEGLDVRLESNGEAVMI